MYRVLVVKYEGKRRIARPRRRWEDNIKMDLKDLECGSTDWIELAQAAGCCVCDDEPLSSIEHGDFFD